MVEHALALLEPVTVRPTTQKRVGLKATVAEGCQMTVWMRPALRTGATMVVRVTPLARRLIARVL